MVVAKASIAAALAIVLVSPFSAGWSAFGSIEPSTPYDNGEWMFPTASLAGSKVYFNVLSGSHYPPASASGKPYVNPNVAALRTQIEPFGLEYHVAFLGVWIDCNEDGYIGQAEGALREYASEVLLDDRICPETSGPIDTWTAGAHNYNGWVSELVPVSRGTNLSNDARVYRDDETRVWGDFHRPDERPFHRSCALFPWPRGTFQSVGGFVNYFDCRFDLLGPANDAFALAGDPLGLSFSDEDDARSGPLGQIETAGTEDSERAAVTLADCEAEPMIHSGDTFNGTPIGPSVPATLQNRTVPTLDPETNDLDDPTAPGQINRTLEEFAGDCDTSNDFGHDTYGQLETDFNGVNPNNKIEADWNFGAATVLRGRAVSATAAGTTVAVPLPSHPGAAGAPSDGGVGIGGTRFVSDSTWASKLGPRSLAADLENGGVAVAPAYWLSFYAHVGAASVARGLALPGGTGTYGAWHCGENDSGIHNGWNCDGSLWYQNPDGSFPNDPTGLFAKPGWSYELRDVDCYDGRIGDTGIGVQPAYYGPAPCP